MSNKGSGTDVAVGSAAFKRAFRIHPAGVALVTADAGWGPAAMTVSSVSSVSVDPHLVVFSVSARSSAAPVLTAAANIAVHLLGADQLALAMLGATSGADRFAESSLWSRTADGTPVFHHARPWMRTAVLRRIPAGEATLIVGEVVELALPESSASTDRLVYHDGTWRTVGATVRS